MTGKEVSSKEVSSFSLTFYFSLAKLDSYWAIVWLTLLSDFCLLNWWVFTWISVLTLPGTSWIHIQIQLYISGLFQARKQTSHTSCPQTSAQSQHRGIQLKHSFHARFHCGWEQWVCSCCSSTLSLDVWLSTPVLLLWLCYLLCSRTSVDHGESYQSIYVKVRLPLDNICWGSFQELSIFTNFFPFLK